MPTPPSADKPSPVTSPWFRLDDPIAGLILLLGGLNLMRGLAVPDGLPREGPGRLDPTY